MPKFAVRYIAAPGMERDAVVEASRAEAVAATLRVRNRDLLKLVELDGTAPDTRGTGRPIALRRTASRFPLKAFCQELATLLDSGIALYDALRTLGEKERNPAASAVLGALVVQLEQGQSFSQALRLRPDAFPVLFVASIEASQRTGQVTAALRRHADYLGWLGSLRDKVVSASIYPAMLVVAGTLVMAFLTLFVLPRFAMIYADLGSELPLGSRLLLLLGEAVGGHPLLVLALVVGGGLLLAAAVRRPSVRATMASALWRLPQAGERLRLLQLARLYRTLGLLLQAGVPVDEALSSATHVVSPIIQPSVGRVARQVMEGGRLSDTLEAERLTTPVSLRMVRVGESSGSLGEMLERAASFYDEELARFTEWVSKVVNPVLMLIMGLLIGTIVVLMYLPIFQLAEQVQ